MNRLLEELELYLADKQQSWELMADGSYKKLEPCIGDPVDGMQTILLNSLSTHVMVNR